MKKLVTAFAFAVLGLAAAQAEQLSPAQALARMQSQSSAPHRVAGKGLQAAPVFTSEVEGTKALYVFNSESDNGGYVILSADDVAMPVLGYADAGAFDPDNIPSNMAWWLGQYAKEIKWAIDNGMPAINGAPARQTRPSIAPLVTSKWNQGDPYNQDCPQVNNQRCVTGCVATAMAQIMYYHKWPQTAGKGSTSYEWNNTTLSMNFANVVFDWAYMTDTYDSSSTAAQKAAVAELMRACGISTHMGYSPSASGAQSEMIAWALTEYFDYDKGMQTLSREAYTLSDWEQLLYDELAAKRPVQYSGRTLAGEGHAFVCDGYNDGYFHINWGWGGASDGYFLTSVLDPNDQGIGGAQSGMAFVTDQGAIVGIQKNKGTATRPDPYLLLNGDFLPSKAEYTLTENVELGGQPGNGGYVDFTGSVGLKFVKTTGGNPVYVTAFNVDLLPPAYYYNSEYTEVVNAQTICNAVGYAQADYIVSLAYRYNGGQWRECVASPTRVSKLKMSVKNDKLVFERTADEIKLSIGSVTALTPFYLNRKFAVKATATVEKEYSGVIRACFVSPGTNNLRASGEDMHITIEPGSREITYASTLNRSSSSTTAGNYELVFINSEGVIVSDRTPVSIEADPGNPVLSFSDLHIVTGETAPQNNVQFAGKVTCTSGYFYDVVQGCFYPSTGGNWLGSVSSGSFSLKPGETKEFVAAGAFDAGVVGTLYVVLPYCNGVLHQDKWTFFTLTEAEVGDIAPTSVSITPESLTLEVGEGAVLSATIAPANATQTDLTWSVSDASIASVANGNVTALAPGTATVTVTTVNGHTATCAVTVTQSPTGVSLSPAALSLVIGEKAELTATIEPANATQTDLTWTVSNAMIAKVDNGTVTALNAGTATITVTTVNGHTATCEVTVDRQEQSISWTQTFDGISEGDAVKLQAKASSGLTVTYSITEGADLAELKGSTLKVLKAGTIKVKAEQAGNTQYEPAEPVEKEITALAGLESAIIGQAWAKAEGGCIVISADGEAEIYTASGRLVYRGADRRVAVEAGVYIVRIGCNVAKVVI